jgi:hypothetical protein
MAEGRLPKRALKWMPKQESTRKTEEKLDGRNKKAMNERNLSEGHWEDGRNGV